MIPVFSMRIISQNIKTGTIKVADNIIASSGYGVALFVGFTQGDDENIIHKMAEKVINMRLFPDADGKTNLSLMEVNGAMLVIPNFTLYGSLRKARRPSFSDALIPDKAQLLYNKFIEELQNHNIPLAAGIFGADMEITLVNDGPFTIIIDSECLFGTAS